MNEGGCEKGCQTDEHGWMKATITDDHHRGGNTQSAVIRMLTSFWTVALWMSCNNIVHT